MRFLPIVERELRVSSRLRGTYWLRSFVALVVIVVSAGIFLFNLEDSPRDLGQNLFITLTSGALLYCLLAGLRGTADCISEEKREGTLGLLFLTDLKGYDVVLGKMAANSFSGFYGLLAILPVLGIPLLLGGLTGTQVARVAAALVNTMFFSMCLGIFASASCRSGRKAIGLTFFLILFFTGIVPGLGAWLAWKNNWRHFEEVFLLTSPIFSYVSAASKTTILVPATAFYLSLGVIHALGWLFLALACVITPRSWQDHPAGVAQLRWRERFKLWGFGDAAQRREFRARLLDQNAFFWLTARARLKPALVWFFLGLVACFWLWGAVKLRRDWLHEGVYIATAFLLNSILKNWLASEAVRQLSEDRKMGSLELLLSTPLTVKEILRGQALALRRQFFWPVFVTLLAEFAMLIAASNDEPIGSEQTARVSLWLAGMIIFVADLFALYWVGMWLGLSSKNPKRAYSNTVFRILTVPWLGWLAFMALAALVSMYRGPAPRWQVILGAWFVLSLAVDFGFGAWARHKLLTEFRVVATQRYLVRPSLWKRLFGSGEATAKPTQ